MTARYYRVGQVMLAMPEKHLLDNYQQRFQLYDRALPEIARVISAKYPDMTAVDIGANIGDSAALICQYREVPVLCIEGNPPILEYLRQNLPQLPKSTELVEALVGPASGTASRDSLQQLGTSAAIDFSQALDRRGTSSPGNGVGIPIRPLREILRDHPRFKRPRFIKSDTDGSDFEIIQSSADVLQESHPILFFEYDPTFRRNGIKAGLETIALLEKIGYRHFLVYDNYGNMMSYVEDSVHAQFQNLTTYIMSHFMSGRQIHYLDVCAFTEADADLAAQIYDDHCDLIEANIRHAGFEF